MARMYPHSDHRSGRGHPGGDDALEISFEIRQIIFGLRLFSREKFFAQISDDLIFISPSRIHDAISVADGLKW